MGGSVPLGCLGYVNCAKEIANQAEDLGVDFDIIVSATGSGGTYAGLTLGAKLFLPGTVSVGEHGVVGLGPPGGEDHVRALGPGVGEKELQLADLVAPQGRLGAKLFLPGTVSVGIGVCDDPFEAISLALMPSFAAQAAVSMAWLDWGPPAVRTTSAPLALGAQAGHPGRPAPPHRRGHLLSRGTAMKQITDSCQ